MATIVMSEVLGYEAPFEDLGITSDMFVSLEKLENVTVDFIEARSFENDKGPGVYIAFREHQGDKMGYTTTHSRSLIDVFTSEAVRKVFDEDDDITGTIKQKTSKKTGYKYFMVE